MGAIVALLAVVIIMVDSRLADLEEQLKQVRKHVKMDDKEDSERD